MKTARGPLKIIIACAGIILIAILFFVAGYLYSHADREIPAALLETPSPDAVSSAEVIDPAAPYDASPPSRGAYIETLSIAIVPDGDRAIVNIPSARAARVQAGQDVVLYRADGMLLEILGNVQSIEQDETAAAARVVIALNGDEKRPSSDAARGEIVLYRSKEAQRLPHSAIDKSTNPPSLWEAVRDENKQMTAVRREANIIGQTYDFVVVDQPDYVSNVYILNPDSGLLDGGYVETRTMLYAAPPETPDMAVARAIDERTPRVIGDPYRGPPIVVPCEMEIARAGSPNTLSTAPANPLGQGCGSQRDSLQQFIDSIRAGQPTP